ncbi:MAG TPA: hypothetical protein VNJ46_04070 [Gaiellaceae bacterium]|nr:hypothetical protein [Gaiellaceae bacterium]
MRGVLALLLQPRRLLTLVGALLAAAAYVWLQAVRAVPRVRRRKAARRAAWQARARRP